MCPPWQGVQCTLHPLAALYGRVVMRAFTQDAPLRPSKGQFYYLSTTSGYIFLYRDRSIRAMYRLSCRLRLVAAHKGGIKVNWKVAAVSRDIEGGHVTTVE